MYCVVLCSYQEFLALARDIYLSAMYVYDLL